MQPFQHRDGYNSNCHQVKHDIPARTEEEFYADVVCDMQRPRAGCKACAWRKAWAEWDRETEKDRRWQACFLTAVGSVCITSIVWALIIHFFYL